MATRRQIIAALQKVLPDLDAEALEETSARRVTGVVVSDRFEDLEHDQRQRLLWSALDGGFNQEDLRNVGPVVALTFREAYARQRDAG